MRGAHHVQQPVDTGAHQAVTNQKPDSLVSASTSDLQTPTDASTSIISANTSMDSDSGENVTQLRYIMLMILMHQNNNIHIMLMIVMH